MLTKCCTNALSKANCLAVYVCVCISLGNDLQNLDFSICQCFCMRMGVAVCVCVCEGNGLKVAEKVTECRCLTGVWFDDEKQEADSRLQRGWRNRLGQYFSLNQTQTHADLVCNSCCCLSVTCIKSNCTSFTIHQLVRGVWRCRVQRSDLLLKLKSKKSKWLTWYSRYCDGKSNWSRL